MGAKADGDVLESQSFGPLAAVLRARMDKIVARWEALVPEVLPTADQFTLTQVRDHIPQTLAKLADALGSSGPAAVRSLAGQASGHGMERYDQGYNIEELIVEYRLLRRVVIEEVELALHRRTSMTEDLALAMGIDTVLQQAVVTFVKQQCDDLRAGAEAESKFLRFISHDLRNQINNLSLSVQVLTMNVAGQPQYAQDIEQARRAQRAMLDTVEGMEKLLKATQLRKGQKVAIRREPVYLVEVAAQVVNEFAGAAEAKGIKLSVLMPPDAVVNSDRSMLALILQNLVSNAVKFSEYGTVTIAAAPADGQWSIAVADEGPGIAPEQHETIFGEFVRGQTHGQPGAGLGLAIAWQAAKLIDGQVTVESAVNVGTTIRLTLPQSAAGEGNG